MVEVANINQGRRNSSHPINNGGTQTRITKTIKGGFLLFSFLHWIVCVQGKIREIERQAKQSKSKANAYIKRPKLPMFHSKQGRQNINK